ncbi:MAG: Mfa1 family fimbria major subunit [Mediterranea sp.]|jgi:hypothetical protein|nr:Mfa1 family fimbria major subunit [Mediterranea sp.]
MKKTLFKIACLSLILGFGACTQTHDDGADITIEEGDPTLMALSLSFPVPDKTRGEEETGLASESAINTVDVFIYGANRVYLSHTRFLQSDFDITGGKYTGKKLIKTTSGLKFIFVGANLPETVIQKVIDGFHTTALSTEAQYITKEMMVGSGEDAFVMCSKELESKTLATYTPSTDDATDPNLPADNKFDVELVRLAAKVTVAEGKNLERRTPEGTFVGNIEFAVDHFNNKTFLLQGSAPKYADPNWDEPGWKAGDKKKGNDSIKYSNYWDDLAKKPAGTGYQAINQNGTAFAQLAKAYVAENTSEPGILLKGTLTRLIIRGRFKPDYVYVANDQQQLNPPLGYQLQDNRSGDVGTFYLIMNSAGQAYYCLDGAILPGLSDAVKGASDNRVYTYTNGYCYYDLWLNNDEKAPVRYQPLRNEYYACTITAIKALGNPTEELDDPDMTMLEPTTNIAVDMDIMPWTVVPHDYVLGE